MDLTMSIADYSMEMSQTQLMSDIGMAVLDMSMDSFEGMASEVARLMESSVTPHLGQNLDITV